MNLPSDEGYDIMIRNLKKEIEIFREENVPLLPKLIPKRKSILNLRSNDCRGKWKGTNVATSFGFPDVNGPKEREEVYNKITDRRLQDKEALDNLFSILVRFAS